MLDNRWTCAQTDAHLDEALTGDLGPVRTKRFSHHRQVCPRCRCMVEDAVRTVGLLRSMPFDDPGPDFTQRVVAAQRAAAPERRVAWVRVAEVTVVWAVCFSVALIGLAVVLWPGLREAPLAEGAGLLWNAGQVLRGLRIAGSVVAGSVGVGVWLALIGGFLGVYAAALTGLRRFLVRRPTA